jgi:uncharacterized protein YdgA (DUF945 family)
MAKVTKIIASLVGVSVLWLGGTALISLKTKSYLESYVKKNNTLYRANGVEMSIENFKKGFFSSDAEVKIDFTNPKMKAKILETMKLPIMAKYSIENGPIFFKNGLGFGLSRIQNKVNMSDYYADKSILKEYLKSDVVFTSNTTVDFLSNANFEGSSNKIIIDLDGEDLVISPLQLRGKMNVETFEGKMNIIVDSVAVVHNDEFFKANDISMVANLKKVFDNGFYLGDFVFNVENIDTKGIDLPFSLENAKLNMLVDINQNHDKTVNIDFKIKGNSGTSILPANYAFLKKAEVSYSLHGMKLGGLLAFQDFTKELQAKQQDILSRLHSSSGELDMDVYAELEKMQTQTKEDMIVLMAGLLKKDTSSLSFETNMLDKNNKKSTLSMNMGYVGDIVLPKDAKALETTFKKELLNLITLDFDVNLEKDYIASLPEELQGGLAGQLQMGMMFGLVKENNNSFSFEANYKPRTLKVNGADKTEMLQMIEMGLSAAGN